MSHTLTGRDGSPSRPPSAPHDTPESLHSPDALNTPGGRFGEASLPIQQPTRKWLYHEAPSWVKGGQYFITICSTKRGQNTLCNESVWGIISDAVLHYHANLRWWVHLWLNMPDHIHAILSFPQNQSMNKVITAFKRYTAKESGLSWQKGFFDHRLRNDESSNQKWHYIRNNPVRKNLVSSPSEWPYELMLERKQGRDGSPSRPPSATHDTPESLHSPDALNTPGGRFGEASLPIQQPTQNS